MRGSVALARTGAVALLAALLAAALQRTDPGPSLFTVVALSLLAVAGAAIWLVPESPPGHTIFLASSACHSCSSRQEAAEQRPPHPGHWQRRPDLSSWCSPGASLMRRRWAIATTIAGGLLAGPVRMLVYDPFLDPSCLGCGHVAVALWPHPRLAAAMEVVGFALALVATTWDLIHRRLVLAGIVTCLVGLAIGLPRLATLVLAGTYVTAVWTRRCWIVWRRRSALRRLLVVHEHESGLTGTLRRTMRDPSLLVTFPTTDGAELSTDGANLSYPPNSKQRRTSSFRVSSWPVSIILPAPTCPISTPPSAQSPVSSCRRRD